MENEKITVIAVEPGKKPYVQEIQGGLESLQREVGGDIQAVYPYDDLIVGLGEDNFVSIPEELIPKYTREFQTPEQLVQIGEKNYILPAMDETAVYQHTAAYAREHNELPQYRESLQANIACKEAIEKAVGENYNGWSVETPEQPQHR